MNIVEEILRNKFKPVKEQILSSIRDTKQSLKSEKIGEDTRKYLENYLSILREKVNHLGLN
jgi:hypothetical protein